MRRAIVAPLSLCCLLSCLTQARTASADVIDELAERGLRGKVVDPEGRPVAGAVVKCTGVRTPGEGIFGDRPPAPVTTDATGRFLLLPPTKDLTPFDGPAPGPGGLPERLPQHGDLLPANSTFTIDVDVPADDRFFPYHGEHPNVGLHVIRLQRVERRRTLRLEAPEGGFVTDRNVLAGVRLLYQSAGSGDRYWLDPKYLGGGKLAPGTYQAESEALRYSPLVVSADSPAELVMKLQPPPTYEGRVVDGVTGEPLAGAIVIGMTATGDGRLADLEPADWDALELRPSAGPRPEQVLAAWAKVYRAHSFDLRAPTTGADGRFILAYKPGLKVPYGLIVFARDRLPMLCRNYAAKPEPNGRVAVRDVPLFPAARVAISVGFKRDPADPRGGAG
ncbi:MAG TPA: carboxypeptidase-like regulatory domain-containing protein, partial [Humisphaera sp.]